MSNEKTYRRRFEEQVIASSRLSDKCIELQAENEQLKKWQIKPSEAICLTDLACRHKKVFKND